MYFLHIHNSMFIFQ